MTVTRYILQSLRHYRFAYLGVLAGAVLGATVLLGALFAGDSVAESLKTIAAKRVGRATHAITAGDRFFRQALAAELAAAARARVAPVLFARGTATHATSRATANQVQLVGVTDAFWQLAPTPTQVPLDRAAPTVAVNDTLARRLNLAKGDTLVVRLQKPGIIGGNAPVAGAESSLQSIRCAIAAIVDDTSFGRFSLDATQVPPPSVFLPIEQLQTAVGTPERANLLLIDAAESPADLARTLASTVKLADYGLTLNWLEVAGAFEISSNRIFIAPELATALTAAVPEVQTVASYLVNEFRAGDRSTPYSIGAATTHLAAPFLPADLGPREIVLNDWLADDLKASVGDDVRVTYFQAGASGALVEQRANFRVRAVVPLQGLAADRAWMPNFPGMSDAKTTGDWNPGLPLNLELIRPHDEKYWDEHRGAPKAFLSPAAGQEIWATRWGSFTSLRIPFAREREAELTATLLKALRPEMNQLIVRNLRSSAQAAAKSSVDFGGLFAGMSFFLILAAFGLVAMLFQFCLLQRNREDALLGAVGLQPRTLLRWRLGEGAVVLVVGALIALPLATLYTRGILRFLETIWAGQGSGPAFVFAAQPASIAAGGAAFLVFSLFAIWLTIRRQTQRTLSIRLAAHAEETAPAPKARRRSLGVAVASAFAAAAAIGLSDRGLPAQAAFYLAGAALLTAGIALCRAWLMRSAPGDASLALDAAHLGALNLKARRSRSLTVVGLIATAVFMVLSVASFRKQVGADWLDRGSGTGGFALLVETTSALNVARDGRSLGFEFFEGNADLGDILAWRAGAGDNVNCFNLNSTTQPQLLAVDTAKLAARHAFKVKMPGAPDSTAAWNALRTLTVNGAIPALVDETTMMWALKRKVGDLLTYTDETGRAFNVQIAGTLSDSVFQGYLLVDEQRFLEKYPSNPGYSVFLVDAKPSANLPAVRNKLEGAVRDAGGRVSLTREVLAAFHEIENTYIAIFNVLGSLGVILGSLGLAIVVARNLRERRGEFAVMTAIGVPREVLAKMVFAEFSRLVLWGLAIGALASLVAIWPSLQALPAATTLVIVAVMLAGIASLNLVCGVLIFRWSLRDLRPSVLQTA